MNKYIPWQIITDSFVKELPPDEQSALEHWRADADHVQLYDELENLYHGTRTQGSMYNPDKEAGWQALSSRLNLPRHRTARLPKRYMSLRTFYTYATVAAVTLVLLIASTFYVGRHSVLGEIQELTYSSYGGKSKMVLPDGTQVYLHGLASVKYPSIFSGPTRSVSLIGEAYFIVAKDEKQPFVINALDKLNIKVLGTQFNVDAQPVTEHITVSLKEGSVMLHGAGTECLLKPGDKAVFNKVSGRFDVKNNNADVAFESLWLSHKINFEQENLEQVCRKLEKWYNVTICVDQTIASNYKYTFTLQDEPLEEILRIMSRINPIRYSFPETKVVEIKSR